MRELTSMKDNDELWLVIPTANRFQYLENIFNNSRVAPEKRIIIRTASGPDLSHCVNLYELQVFNIQYWWNLGIEYVRNHGGRYVAVLNDDVELQHGVLQELLHVMKLEGTALALPVDKGDAAWGHCWILDIKSGIRPDERFTWWCGDRDLEIQAKKSWGISYNSLPTLNIHANELTASNTELEQITKQDIRSFYFKYPIRSAANYPIRFLRRIVRRLRKK
jgi:hypothetical protein